MVDAAPGREAFPEVPATIQASNLRPLSGDSVQALFALVATTGKCAEEMIEQWAPNRLGRKIFLVALAVGLACSTAFAQTQTGSITGTVTGQQGGVLPGRLSSGEPDFILSGSGAVG